eukprot:TRINITY_DN7417_c0_g1_i3.p1 TRINITY_DN7417_c0_g1~~TRINITY_DN7417_c0_g1_i3.p1  ORF type:complete len:535 (-),score=53.24 TRINITY_DN7417_c0_g1_i3:111-1715(-)
MRIIFLVAIFLFYKISTIDSHHVLHRSDSGVKVLSYEQFYGTNPENSRFSKNDVNKQSEKRTIEIPSHTAGIGVLLGGVQTSDYFMKMSVGQPQQTFSVEVDTGSSISVLVGKNCKDNQDGLACAHTISNGGYDQGPSSKNWTYDAMWCDKCSGGAGMESLCCRDTKYYDGTEGSGWLVNDVVSLFGVKSSINFINVQRQSINGENSLFSSYMDGILGLSDVGPFDVLSDIEDDNPWIDGAFCMCFGISDGLFVAGLNNCTSGLYNSTEIHYTPYFTIPTSPTGRGVRIGTDYTIQLSSMGFAKEHLTLSGEYSATVDSGTHGVLLPTPLYKQFVQAVQNYCKHKSSSRLFCDKDRNLMNIDDRSCLYTTRDELRKLPDLRFGFPDGNTSRVFEITMNGTVYVSWFPITSLTYEYCARLVVEQSTNPWVTLGDNFLHGLHTIFDRKHHRIGFSHANKSTCGNVVYRNLGLQLLLGFIGLLVLGVILFAVIKQYQKRNKYRIAKNSISVIGFNSTDDLIGYERRSLIRDEEETRN